MPGENILQDARTRMGKAVEATNRDMETVRSGRASPRLVEGLRVDYYGQMTPLLQLAGIHPSEAHLLTIQPYDRSIIAAIEKAIRTSDLGLNPTNDGAVVRLAVPPLTEDRRKELVKRVHKKAEDGHVAVRNIRRNAQDAIRKQEKAHEISEDESRRLQEQLQKITEEHVRKIDATARAKEADVLAI